MIPWDVSIQDLEAFFSDIPAPPEHLQAQHVHILMDRCTGKTQKSAYVELAITSAQATYVARTRRHKSLKGRVVSVEVTTQDELLGAIFPGWKGQWIKGEPVPSTKPFVVTRPVINCSQNEVHKVISVADHGLKCHSGGSDSAPPSANSSKQPLDGNPPTPEEPNQAPFESRLAMFSCDPTTAPFVTREEISAILLVCRNYKLYFSRKCAERPYENIISIICKYPWHRPELILPLHRDHIFELLKLAVEALRIHMSKENHTIHPTLLVRMIRCAVLTPAFTEKQKMVILRVAGRPCPEDLVPWLITEQPKTEIDATFQPSCTDEPSSKASNSGQEHAIVQKGDSTEEGSIQVNQSQAPDLRARESMDKPEESRVSEEEVETILKHVDLAEVPVVAQSDGESGESGKPGEEHQALSILGTTVAPTSMYQVRAAASSDPYTPAGNDANMIGENVSGSLSESGDSDSVSLTESCERAPTCHSLSNQQPLSRRFYLCS
ncbi:hypothetical protein BGW41_002970 [Actinomortierella wolfii]|nr:hypothetical protein BGW41_002970 [Actinomortierella wolfii]